MARTRQKWDSETERATRSLDALAAYEEFCESVLPPLRSTVVENWSPEKIRKTFAAITQAQVVSKALRGDIRAIKDVLDRMEGSPITRREIDSKYENLSREELISLVLSKLKASGVSDSKSKAILPEKKKLSR